MVKALEKVKIKSAKSKRGEIYIATTLKTNAVERGTLRPANRRQTRNASTVETPSTFARRERFERRREV